MKSINSFFVAVAALFFVTIGFVKGFSHGAPKYSCKGMIPGHINGTMSIPPPYRVAVTKSVIMPGESTTVTLESTEDFPFIGFLCAVSDLHDANNNTLGRMSYGNSASVSLPRELKTLNCSRSTVDTAITHASKADKFRVDFDWLAPPDATVGQQYKLRCSVVMTFMRCWTNIQTIISIGTSSSGGSSGSFGAGASGSSGNSDVTSSAHTMNNNNNNDNSKNNSPGVSDPSTQGTSIFQPITTTTTGNSNGGSSPGVPTQRPNNAPTVFPTQNVQGNFVNRPVGGSNNINNNPIFPEINPSAPFNPSLNTVNPFLGSGIGTNNELFSNPGLSSANPNLNDPFPSGGLFGRNPNAVTNPGLTRAPGLGLGLGQGQGNSNRNRNFIPPQNVNNDNSNAPGNLNTVRPTLDPFFDTSFLENNPSDPNLLDRNLIRTNERFVDPNAMSSQFTFDFPSAFFLTPSALRLFQQRNNERFGQQTLAMFQEF